jgi:predicted DNA-binding protein (UPF0251 family)
MRNRKNAWTQEEIDFLIQNYYKNPTWCAEQLNRSRAAVVGRAQKLNLLQPVHQWTKEQEELIIKDYQLLTAKEISQKMGVSRDVVTNKIASLNKRGLINKKQTKKIFFSEAEREIIQKYYPEYGSPKCLELIKNKTVGQINDYVSE